MPVTDDVQVSDLSERLWDAITNVRDAYPRRCDDAGTDELVDAIMPIIEGALAQAWDQGRAAERRDWEFTTFDLATPDEERQSLPNPYQGGER